MTIRHDLLCGWRLVRRDWFPSIVVVLSVAVCVAGAGAIAALGQATLYQGRPGVGDADTLVDVSRTLRGACCDNFSYADYLDLRRQVSTLEGLAAYRLGSEPMLVGRDSVFGKVLVSAVSDNFFDVFRVRMIEGDGLGTTRTEGRPPVVVSASWRHAYFAAAESVVGQPVVINGHPFTVVGVADQAFRGHGIVRSDAWIALTDYPALTGRDGAWLTDPRVSSVQLTGRRRAPFPLAATREELGAIDRGLIAASQPDPDTRGTAVNASHSLPAEVRPVVTGFFLVLLALSVVVTVVAGINIAGLLLARNLTRARELAVRFSLGASRATIVWQLLIETTLLIVPGTVAGLVGISVILGVLERWRPLLPMQLAVEPRLSPEVGLFMFALALTCGLAAAAAPAARAAQGNFTEALRSDALNLDCRRLRWRRALVTAQLATTGALVICATVLAQSMMNAGSIDRGITTANLDVMSLNLGFGAYDDNSGPRFTQDLLLRLAEAPNVQEVAAARVLPLTGQSFSLGTLQSAAPGATGTTSRPDWNVVTPNYFAVLQIPFVAGGPFSDRASAPPADADVAIINQTLARSLFGETSALNQELVHPTASGERRLLRVVGVVADGKYRSLGERARPFVYLPFSAQYSREYAVIAKRRAAATPLTPVMEATLAEIDPKMPPLAIGSFDEMIAAAVLPQQVAASITALFAAVAIFLSVTGVFALNQFSLQQRRREIGVRLAVGATRRGVIARMLRPVLTMTAIGLVLGSVVGIAIAQLLQGLVYGVEPTDPGILGISAAVLAVASVGAAWWPVSRFMRSTPLQLLRNE